MSQTNIAERKYKIGFFSDTFHPQLNGVVTSIDSFKKQLTDRGHDVYMFVPEYETKNLKEDKGKIFRFPSVSYPFYKEFRITWPYSIYYNRFKKLGLDIYHLHSPFSIGILGFFLSRMYKKPIVMTYHTLWKEYGPRYAPYLPKTIVEFMAVTMSKTFCNRLDAVIVPSKAMQKEIESYGLTTPVVVVPSGFTFNKSDYRTDLDLHARFNIPKGHKIILFVGRIGTEKNISLLLDSYQIVSKKLPKTHLLIVGDGPYADNYKQQAVDLGIAEKTTFTGFLSRDEVIESMEYSDLFAFPSVTETQGIVILEALACGLPTVAVNRMGSIDYLEDGKGGILTEPTTKGFSKGIYQLLTSKNYSVIKKEAVEKAKLYTESAVTDRLLDVYDMIYNKKMTKKK